MCLVSPSKQLSQRKSFLCLVNFEIRMWQSTSLGHAVISLCPLGSAGLRPLVLSDTMANCWAWRGFQSLPTWDGWELVILLYEAPYPTAFSHSIPWLSLHIRIYLFFEYFANGSWRVAGSLQSVSLNTLWDLSLAYFIFSFQREGVYKSKRSGKLLASQELPALLPLFAPFSLMMFFIINQLKHRKATSLSWLWDTGIGVQIPLVSLSEKLGWCLLCILLFQSA